MLKDIAEEKTKIAAVKGRYEELRTQMEDDYSLIRLDPFVMPKEEGIWQNYTSNSPATLNGSYVRTLAGGVLKLFIKPLSEETGKKKASKARTMTEQLVNGAIWTANRMRVTTPEEKDLQSALASDACERGGTILYCYLREEDGKLISDMGTWDALNSYWISGTKGLLWVCLMRFGAQEQLEEEYQGTFTPDEQGRVSIYNVWDTEEFGVFCENGGGEWIHKEEHGLGHIPVSIRSVGERPLRQSSKQTDTLKDSWQSSIAYNRNLYKSQRRLMTYILTQAGMKAKPTQKLLYDGTGGALPPEISKGGPQQGRIIPLDVSKKEDLAMIQGTLSIEEAFEMLVIVERQLSLGGIAPIALGFTAEAQTASGTAQLTEAARQSLSPFKRNMEAQSEWLAEEITQQYKNGKFEETELEGYEWNGKKFKVMVNPSEINDSEHFTAELNLNLLRDKMGEMAIWEKGLTLGLLSRRGGQENFSDDPDLVQEQIDEAQVSDALGLPYWRVFKELSSDEHGQYSPAKARENLLELLILENRLKQMSGQMAGAPAGGEVRQLPPGGGTNIVPRIEPVGAEIGRIGAEPLTQEARLAKLGMVSARR